MPVIITQRDYDRWLQSGDPEWPPIDLLRPVRRRQENYVESGQGGGHIKNGTPELLQEKQKGETDNLF
jgi:putative SOS response-associated peptidase YedK